MSAMLLSIRPEYVTRIISGEKRFEYRRRLAKNEIDTIYIYSTAPTKKVVASVQVVRRISDSPCALWEHTKQNAGISKTKYYEYFRGCEIAYAYQLGKVTVFDKAKSLKEYGCLSAPQSFVYVDEQSMD